MLVDGDANGWPVDEEVWSVGCLLLMMFGWLIGSIGMVCWLVCVKYFVFDEDAWMPLVDEDTAAKP